MATIKNIIFDLGGVLINIDYNKTAGAFRNLGVNNFEDMYTQFTADALFEHLETGHTSEADFYASMNGKGSGPLTPWQVKDAWNAMLLDFRVESFRFLEQLKDKYDLYLLSNTNIIHKTAFDAVFTAQTGAPSINSYFKKAWYSHEVGLRKPNADMYAYVLKDAGLAANETLFIDDSVNNIVAAARLGIKTHLLLPGETIEAVVPGLI